MTIGGEECGFCDARAALRVVDIALVPSARVLECSKCVE